MSKKLKRFKVYAKNTITNDRALIGEVWTNNEKEVAVKAEEKYGKQLDAFDTLVVEKA